MRKVIFLMTHVGSEWESLASWLERDPRVHCFHTGKTYYHPDDIGSLTSLPHRRSNSASIYCDVILHNKDFAMKWLCNHYNFVFWWRNFDCCHDELHKHYGAIEAQNYWESRMVGLKEYMRRCDRKMVNPDLEGDPLLRSIL